MFRLFNNKEIKKIEMNFLKEFIVRMRVKGLYFEEGINIIFVLYWVNFIKFVNGYLNLKMYIIFFLYISCGLCFLLRNLFVRKL